MIQGGDSVTRSARCVGTAAPAARVSRNAGVETILVIGSSTGGTEALRVILTRLPADAPGVLVTQHMPPGFTRAFADRLNRQCRISVKEAAHQERIVRGHAYIAPGDCHLTLGRSAAGYVALLDNSPPVNRHRPSVELLFRSAARIAGPNAVGIMLTGMGKDGAAAMLEMRQGGAFNIAQDEATCVVFGMPKEAIALGAVDEVLPLESIASRALRHLESIGAGAPKES
jgi:two-component system chemotaxis response regulator CheB